MSKSLDVLSKSKKKKSVKAMKHKKKHKSVNGNEESDDMSLDKDVHSISHYMTDRPAMLEQMFSTINEEKLRAMLPPLLKDETMSNLRSECLEALLGLSSKRIKSVIAGDDLGSQSSDTEDSSVESSSSDDVTDDDRATKPDVTEENKDKTLLEILELECRARAIRASLHQCPSSPVSSDVQPRTQQHNHDSQEQVTTQNKKHSFDQGNNTSLRPNPRKADIDASTDEAAVFLKGNTSKRSKKNIVVIGPSKKSKSKIVYSKKSIRVIDSSKSVEETNTDSTAAGAKDQEMEVTAEELPERQSETESERLIVDKIDLTASHVSDDAIIIISDDESRSACKAVEESWVGRWLQQPENQAAKKNSKIITAIKQKLRVSKKASETESEQVIAPPSEAVSEPVALLGTVDEYQLLPSSATSSNTVIKNADADNTVDTVTVTTNAANRVVEVSEEACVEPASNSDAVQKVLLDVEPASDNDVVQKVLPDVEPASDNNVVQKVLPYVEGENVETASDNDAVQKVLPDIEGESSEQVDDSQCQGDELELHYRDNEDEMQQ